MADHRRDYGSGSVYQRCETRFGCPPALDGGRPEHDCKGRWFGSVNAGYTASAKRRRKTVSASTEAKAKKKLRDLIRDIEDGRRSSDADARTTVKTYAEKWMERTALTSRPSTFATDRAAVEKWIIPTIGHRRLRDLEPDDVRSVARAIRRAGLSSSSAHRYHSPLMRMLKAAALDGHDIKPRVMLTEQPEREVDDRQAIPAADCMKLIGASLDIAGGSRWSLALMQGLRQGESLGLTWNAIDFGRDVITVEWQLQALAYANKGERSQGFRIPPGYEVRHLVGAYHLVRPKSRKGFRVIPLVPWARNALLDWRETAPENPWGLVWPTSAGRPVNKKDDTVAWRALQDASDVHHPTGRHYHVHETRHSTATLLMELGVAESVRLAIMGHSSAAVTRGYEYVDTREARVALERLAQRLGLADSREIA